MHVQCYQKKRGKQFVNFLKRIEKQYDNNIQNIFPVIDNLSLHKSKRDITMLYKNRISIYDSKVCSLT